MAKKKKKHNKADLCPLCGEFMDLYCAGHRKLPFVDGRTYPRMCFTCFCVPKTEEQIYNKDDTIKEMIDLPFSPKHLHTAKELFEAGSSETLALARKSVRSVKAAIKSAKLSRKAKFKKPPEMETGLIE